METQSPHKFNPIREDVGNLTSQRIVWSTETILVARDAINKGKRLIATPFYENDTRKLRANLVYQRTSEEMDEWKRCRDDIVYWINKYCKLTTPEGIQHIQLRDYQVKYLKHLEQNRLSILLACRQAGKTTTSALELLHYILFNIDKMSVVLGNKRRTAVEILSKAKNIFLELPYFLTPGVEKWNESEILLDNGCRCVADATTINPNLGDTVHYALLDEFAHVHPNIVDKFYNQIFPTITAGKAKLRITSTQNGHNLFYRLYKGAIEGTNEYKPFTITWDEVPEWNPETKQWDKRDEQWYNTQVANLGGEENFNKQFGTNFITTSNTLISKIKLRKMNEKSISFEPMDMPGVVLSDSWYWLPELDITTLKDKCLIITCDLAEQLNQDFTIYSVYELLPDGKLSCIGYFRDNKSTREMCALSFIQFQITYCNPEQILVSHERNTYGDVWMKELDSQAEKNGIQNFDKSCFVKYYNESGTQWKNGIKITVGNKTSHCLLLKEDIDLGKIDNISKVFVLELENFCEQKQGIYKASFGHDDLVMCAVQLEFVKESIQFNILKDNLCAPSETIYNMYDDIGNNNYLPDDYFENNSENDIIKRLKIMYG